MARVEFWLLSILVILTQLSVSDGAGQKPQPKTDSECHQSSNYVMLTVRFGKPLHAATLHVFTLGLITQYFFEWKTYPAIVSILAHQYSIHVR